MRRSLQLGIMVASGAFPFACRDHAVQPGPDAGGLVLSAVASASAGSPAAPITFRAELRNTSAAPFYIYGDCQGPTGIWPTIRNAGGDALQYWYPWSSGCHHWDGGLDPGAMVVLERRFDGVLYDGSNVPYDVPSGRYSIQFGAAVYNGSVTPVRIEFDWTRTSDAVQSSPGARPHRVATRSASPRSAP